MEQLVGTISPGAKVDDAALVVYLLFHGCMGGDRAPGILFLVSSIGEKTESASGCGRVLGMYGGGVLVGA